MTAVEPCCARKLIEQATQYAQGLGFAPHPDYKKAARVFGGLDAEQCGGWGAAAFAKLNG